MSVSETKSEEAEMDAERASRLAQKIQERFTRLLVGVKPTTERTCVVVLSFKDEEDYTCIAFSSEQDFEAVIAYAYSGTSSIPHPGYYDEENIRDFRRLIFYQIGEYERARSGSRREV